MQIWGGASEAKPAMTLFHAQSTQRPLIAISTFFTSRSLLAHAITLPSAQEHPMFYVGVYAIIGFLAVIGTLLASATLIFGGYRASKILFKRLLTGVTRATMRWHDTTPTGKILPLTDLPTSLPIRPLNDLI
jgi:ABC-type multidrug transport system fused ATPase/permease subunit